MTKKLILMLALSLLPALTFASAPDNGTCSACAADSTKASHAVKTYYIEVVAMSGSSNNTYAIQTDFGRLLPAQLGIKDEDLKQMQKAFKFKSVIDALNFWASRGWELADSYTLAWGNLSTGAATHFVLKATGQPGDILQSIMRK